MQIIKKKPYGESDFSKVRKNNYYIDKTRFIAELEESPSFIFLIRPRRFGKSLFLSLLESYYDLLLKNEFEALFNDTFVGKRTKQRLGRPVGRTRFYHTYKSQLFVSD